MKVIKKDGRIQEFDKNKLYVSLYNASTNTGNGQLNESDVKIIVEDIYRKLEFLRKEDEVTSSYEITGLLITTLKEDGFLEVLKTFLNV